MTKLTFDVDFNKDPEEILKEIQERAKAEVAKRESKIKSAAFLSKLHEKVNEEIGTDYRSINDLIRALTQFANPKLKEKISSSSASGRRVTVSMTRDLFEDIKSKLAKSNPNKAAIARETGASVVQVRKVASGGYDAKFSGESESHRKSTSTSQAVNATQTEQSDPEEVDNPTTPNLSAEEEPAKENSTPELLPIAPPSMGEEIAEEPAPLAPPPAPSLDLPPVPAAPEPISPPSPDEQVTQEDSPAELPPIAPPSMGEEIAEEPAPIAPPPAPSLDLPPEPSAPAPSEPPAPEPPSAPPEPSAAPGKPKLSLKPKGKKPGLGGKPGKPTLSLKSGKKKPTGLKLTRPPMKPPSA